MYIVDSHIVSILRSILAGEKDPAQINELIRHCHKLATVRIKQLLVNGKLHLQSFPISIESAALDCIAELFTRDHDYQFIELQDYFSGKNDPTLLDDILMYQSLRMLVFRKLHDGIFRLYRENDPILSKILRSIKLAISKDNRAVLFERFGLSYVCYSTREDRNDHLSEYNLDDLEKRISELLKGSVNTKKYLQILFEVLNDPESQNSRALSIIDTAVVLKRISLSQNDMAPQSVVLDEEMMLADAESYIKESLVRARLLLYDKYVTKDKITEAVFHDYFEAIQQIIVDTFIQNDGSQKSYYDYLKLLNKELNYDEYRNNHRVRFEYMVTLAKTYVRDDLKNIF